MTFKAVFFDLGGVIVRTEDRTPRTTLAERLGMTYEQMDKAVFAVKTSRDASLGLITEEQHWDAVVAALKLPAEEKEAVRREFFAGDAIDRTLLDFIRTLKPRYHTGVISNAWNGLRDYMIRQKFDDAFEQIIISAEAGMMKPDARIYQLALTKMNVAATEALFVDDVIENIEACRALGMTGIHFRSAEQVIQELKQVLQL